jgi:hypothetical protein
LSPQTKTHESQIGGPDATKAADTRDDAIRAVVARLARRHPSGDMVIERAAILAEGADCAAVVAWIMAHAGEPEAAIISSAGGLHGPRLSESIAVEHRPPARYVLRISALA